MKVVLDASAFLSMMFEDERTAETAAMEQAIETGGAIVPALWRTEVQNALLTAERAGRTTQEDAHAILAVARAADIEIDTQGPELTFGAEYVLARSFNLSVYDAMYLELAQRKNVPLMTVDRGLRSAAQSIGLAWDKKFSLLPAFVRSGKRQIGVRSRSRASARSRRS